MQLENSVGCTYSELCRSAYDLAWSMMIMRYKAKPPRITSTPNGVGARYVHSTSRDITLVDNGLIVERVAILWREKREREHRFCIKKKMSVNT